MRFVHELAHEPTALQPARAALEAWCSLAQADPESLVIIANELCANAVRHGKGSITLQASHSERWLSISIQQYGKVALAMPARYSQTELHIAGRGLRMVDALAESWGWHTTSTHTLLWARIARRRA